MATTSAAHWPPELLLSVLDSLSLADLLSVTRTCRHWAMLAGPLVYAQLDVAWTWDSEPPLSLLLRTLLDRRDLAGHVCHVRLRGRFFTEHGRPVREPPALPVDELPIDKASQAIRSTGVPHAQLWLDELRRGSADALVALFVSLLPNLESLHLGPNFAIENRLLGTLLRCALCEPPSAFRLPAFQRLGHVQYSCRTNQDHHRSVCNAADVLPFFYAPHIRRLSVSIDNPRNLAWPTESPTFPSLVSLELFRLRESRLETILSPLDDLSELHWHCFYQADLDRDVSQAVVQLDTLAAALSRVADSLVDLTIDAETSPATSFGEYDPPPLQLRGSLSRLSDLTRLVRLTIPWDFMMGSSPAAARRLGDGLPRSLEMLVLTRDLWDHERGDWDDDSVVCAAESGLVRQPRLDMARLRHIVLPLPQYIGDMTQALETKLGEIGALAGVQLEWDDQE